MPRFFFETDDGDRTVFDEEGAEYADKEAARAAAISVLPDMAREKMPEGDHRTFTVRVLCKDHNLIYKGTMTFEGAWAASSANLAPLRLVE